MYSFIGRDNKLEISNDSALYEYALSLVKKRATILRELYLDSTGTSVKLEKLLSELCKVENLLLVIENNFTFIKGESK